MLPKGPYPAYHLTGGIGWLIWDLLRNKPHFLSQAFSLTTFRCDSKVPWNKSFLKKPLESKPVLRNTTHSLINIQPSLHLYFITPGCHSLEQDIIFPGVEQYRVTLITFLDGSSAVKVILTPDGVGPFAMQARFLILGHWFSPVSHCWQGSLPRAGALWL